MTEKPPSMGEFCEIMGVTIPPWQVEILSELAGKTPEASPSMKLGTEIHQAISDRTFAPLTGEEADRLSLEGLKQHIPPGKRAAQKYLGPPGDPLFTQAMIDKAQEPHDSPVVERHVGWDLADGPDRTTYSEVEELDDGTCRWVRQLTSIRGGKL